MRLWLACHIPSCLGASAEVDVDPCPRGRSCRAFSLMELLVVIGIMGVLAAISFPAMKNIGRTNEMNSGVQQMLDDLTLARQLAINHQTDVHVLFAPPNIASIPFDPAVTPNAAMMTNLMDAPFRGYAIFEGRSIGDQPGRPTFKYESEWKRLPDGVIFQQDQYQSLLEDDRNQVMPPENRPFSTNAYPFPTIYGVDVAVPFLTFDRDGSLLDPLGRKRLEDEFVDLARGSVLATRGPNGNLIDFDVREVKEGPRDERFARIRIDAFSGRARIVTERELKGF